MDFWSVSGRFLIQFWETNLTCLLPQDLKISSQFSRYGPLGGSPVSGRILRFKKIWTFDHLNFVIITYLIQKYVFGFDPILNDSNFIGQIFLNIETIVRQNRIFDVYFKKWIVKSDKKKKSTVFWHRFDVFQPADHCSDITGSVVLPINYISQSIPTV